MAEVYKIRRKGDGLFSMGGMSPYFKKTGKIWKRRADLSNHLNLLYNKNVYNDCEIITYELVEQQVGDGQPIQEYLLEKAARRQERELAEKRRRDEAQRQRRLAQYKELQKEFGND